MIVFSLDENFNSTHIKEMLHYTWINEDVINGKSLTSLKRYLPSARLTVVKVYHQLWNYSTLVKNLYGINTCILNEKSTILDLRLWYMNKTESDNFMYYILLKDASQFTPKVEIHWWQVETGIKVLVKLMPLEIFIILYHPNIYVQNMLLQYK